MPTAEIQLGSSGVDTTIVSTAADSNFGSAVTMTLGNVFVVADSKNRGLIRIDLSTYDGAIFSDATLTLFATVGGEMSGAKTFNAYRLTKTWGETTATWNAPWTTAGGDYVIEDGDSFLVANPTTDIVFSVMAPLMNDGQDLRSNLLELIVIGPEGTGVNDWLLVHSSDGANASKRPKLAFTYEYSVHYQCAIAVRDEIRTLKMPGLPDAQVIAQKLPWHEGEDLPACIVSTWQPETMAPSKGTNLRDDIGYPVHVSFVSVGGRQEALTYKHPRMLLWRQQVARHFRNQRLTGVSEIWQCLIEPANTFLPAEFLRNVDHSQLTVRCMSREHRGSLGVL